eukprot:gene18321-biopygen11452
MESQVFMIKLVFDPAWRNCPHRWRPIHDATISRSSAPALSTTPNSGLTRGFGLLGRPRARSTPNCHTRGSNLPGGRQNAATTCPLNWGGGGGRQPQPWYGLLHCREKRQRSKDRLGVEQCAQVKRRWANCTCLLALRRATLTTRGTVWGSEHWRRHGGRGAGVARALRGRGAGVARAWRRRGTSILWFPDLTGFSGWLSDNEWGTGQLPGKVDYTCTREPAAPPAPLPVHNRTPADSNNDIHRPLPQHQPPLPRPLPLPLLRQRPPLLPLLQQQAAAASPAAAVAATTAATGGFGRCTTRKQLGKYGRCWYCPASGPGPDAAPD